MPHDARRIGGVKIINAVLMVSFVLLSAFVGKLTEVLWSVVAPDHVMSGHKLSFLLHVTNIVTAAWLGLQL